MRVLDAQIIIDAVAAMCIRANQILPSDVRQSLAQGAAREDNQAAQEIFGQLTKNYELAEKTGLPLCQDTGLAIFFVTLGQDLRVQGMGLKEAIQAGTRQGYAQGYLRNSVCDPLTRVNTNDNTPAIIHLDLVPGDQLTIAFMAKGGGSENMSALTMLTPAQGLTGIKDFVLHTVAQAGPNPCPPIVVGVGLGGSFDLAPMLAKKALLRPLGDINPDPRLETLEQELLADINNLGIGPMGLGGKTTALDVKIAMHPCHIASLPVAVNIQCHSARHEEVQL